MVVDEQAIVRSLKQVPAARWGEVLEFLESLRNAELAVMTAVDLSQSPLVGLWADRNDLGDRHQFARELRRQAEFRSGVGDAARH